VGVTCVELCYVCMCACVCAYACACVCVRQCVSARMYKGVCVRACVRVCVLALPTSMANWFVAWCTHDHEPTTHPTELTCRRVVLRAHQEVLVVRQLARADHVHHQAKPVVRAPTAGTGGPGVLTQRAVRWKAKGELMGQGGAGRCAMLIDGGGGRGEREG
jgi:hypothetical protein